MLCENVTPFLNKLTDAGTGGCYMCTYLYCFLEFHMKTNDGSSVETWPVPIKFGVPLLCDMLTNICYSTVH